MYWHQVIPRPSFLAQEPFLSLQVPLRAATGQRRGENLDAKNQGCKLMI